MAGLNFYTQTIINSNEDPDSKKTLFVGSSDEGGSLRILRDFTFYKEKTGYGKTLSVTHKAGHKAKMCKATLDLLKVIEALKDAKGHVAETLCRLDVYLGVEGAEPYIYSTPWVQKGMPFWIEFTIPAQEVGPEGATKAATALAAELEANIKKVHMFQCDKDLVNVSASTKDLVFEGANEFQRFRNIEVVAYDPEKDAEKSLTKLGKAGAVTLNMRGTNGFGTYSQIVKDLRLPTATNWQPNHIRQIETPIIDALYDQFIIEYEAPATNDGLGCVGLRLNSVTTHVFWVKSDVASAFNTAAGKIATVSLIAETAMETDDVADDTNETSAKTPNAHVSNDPHPALKSK